MAQKPRKPSKNEATKASTVLSNPRSTKKDKSLAGEVLALIPRKKK